MRVAIDPLRESARLFRKPACHLTILISARARARLIVTPMITRSDVPIAAKLVGPIGHRAYHHRDSYTKHRDGEARLIVHEGCF